MKSKRLDYLDMARGIGIILVAVAHSQYCAESVRTVITAYLMPLFFVVSGIVAFTIGEEKRSMRDILKRKARGLLVPYVIFSAIYLAIYGGYYYGRKHVGTWGVIEGYLIQTFGLGGMSVLWFLTALFFSELLFLLLLKKCGKKLWAAVLIAAALVAAAVWIHPYFLVHFPQTSIPLRLLYELLYTWLRSMLGVGFLMLGYLMAPLFERLDQIVTGTQRRLIAAAVCVLGLVLTGFLSLYNGHVDMRYMAFNRTWLYFFNTLLGCSSLLLLCKYGKNLRGLTFLGANSLIIMLTHLDCLYMKEAIEIGMFFATVSPRAKVYCLYLGIALSLLVMELVTIYVVNHFLPFVIGKKYPKRKKKEEQH
ncbi:MAG: acyltransferase family protein [Clostridium sp.]|nr:acyltransferase family protein [Clostridium sp.]